MTKPIGNLDLFRQVLDASDVDAVIALSPENFPFTAGCFIGTMDTIRDRLALTIWTKGEFEPVVVICAVEEPQVRAESWVTDIRTYVEFHESPLDRVVEALEEKGLTAGKLGIEMKYITAAYFEELTRRVPKATFVPARDLFYEARMIKTPEEIDLLTQAARATEKALLATYATIAIGETEKSMANRLAANMMHGGLDEVKFLYINAGPNTGYPHHNPSGYQARKGDIVKSDVGGKLRGYPSDVARTAVIGKPSAEQASVYERLVAIHLESIDVARPGKTAADLFNASVAAYAKHDIPFSLPHQGHGLGLEGHEKPLLNAFERTVFQPNMVLCVETRVRWVGKEGYHVEDLILVTENGPKILTQFFDGGELFLI
jgi:Xaa-Pro aminopeptidase